MHTPASRNDTNGMVLACRSEVDRVEVDRITVCQGGAASVLSGVGVDRSGKYDSAVTFSYTSGCLAVTSHGLFSWSRGIYSGHRLPPRRRLRSEKAGSPIRAKVAEQDGGFTGHNAEQDPGNWLLDQSVMQM
jgi:hypothetical protein